MDSSHPKPSDFAVETSPPLFSFELQSSDSSESPSATGFELSTAYGTFPDASALSTSNFVTPYFYNQWHPTSALVDASGLPSSSTGSAGVDLATSGISMPARPAVRRSTRARRSLRGQVAGFSDDEGEEKGKGVEIAGGAVNADVTPRHSEETRLQRIESEQRRRDELRDGYARLKSALPISNQKSSKVSLLDRAITYIRQLETNQNSLQARLENTEKELNRQRGINEGLIRAITEPTRLPPGVINASDPAITPSPITPGESSTIITSLVNSSKTEK